MLPDHLNIPPEKIYELGNWSSVTTVWNVLDLKWDLVTDEDLYASLNPYQWVEAEEFVNPEDLCPCGCGYRFGGSLNGC